MVGGVLEIRLALNATLSRSVCFSKLDYCSLYLRGARSAQKVGMCLTSSCTTYTKRILSDLLIQIGQLNPHILQSQGGIVAHISKRLRSIQRGWSRQVLLQRAPIMIHEWSSIHVHGLPVYSLVRSVIFNVIFSLLLQLSEINRHWKIVEWNPMTRMGLAEETHMPFHSCERRDPMQNIGTSCTRGL